MHQKSNHCTKSNSHLHVRERYYTFVQCTYFETGFGKTLRFIIHKYAKFLLYFMKGCLLFLIQTMYMYTSFALYRFKNNDIPGREICTMSSLMRVSRILQLFSPFFLNIYIIRQIYGGINALQFSICTCLSYHKINNDWNRYRINVWNIQGAPR
jgi:hypothetical protein